MVSRETAPLSRSKSWIRDGWATDRWLFALIFSVGLVCGGSVWAGGIIVIASHPPPAAVWMLAVVCVLIELWCRNVEAADIDEFDAMDVDWDFEQT